jgi:hypothetical protein
MAARSTSPRQIRPSPRSILARDARHPKAHSPRFLGAHNFLACYLCHLVRIAAFRDHRALSFAAGARTRRPLGNPEVTRVVPSLPPPAFPVVPFLALRPRGSTQPPETRRLSGFSDPCAPDPVTDPIEAPRVAPPIGSRASRQCGQRQRPTGKIRRLRTKAPVVGGEPRAAHRSRRTPCLSGIERVSGELSPPGDGGMRPLHLTVEFPPVQHSYVRLRFRGLSAGYR